MIVVAVVGALVAGLRWLRVVQREHYLAGSCVRTAGRWWRLGENLALLAVAVAVGSGGIVVGPPDGAVLTLPAVLAGTAGPLGLGLRGRTSPLAWTRRLGRLAVVSGVLVTGAGLLLWWAGGDGWSFLLPLLAPGLVDLALLVVKPFEDRLGKRWVDRAAATLNRSGARTVAITGSYGKTSTKVVLAHLLSGVALTVASPASFNNRMGLARAINEHVAAGTEIFVAEMGTYGRGEIRQLCEWIPPEVAVMTALGPVHLERMGTLENIASAKREILERATAGVINVDHPLLAAIAGEEAGRIRIITVSTLDHRADVFVDPATGEVVVAGRSLGRHGGVDVHAPNLACALGAVVAMGYDPGPLLARVATAPVAPHRASRSEGASGVTIIDDTFNSNPAGARAALAMLAEHGEGRRVMVTPGMVELGPVQAEENRRLAVAAAGVVTDLIVVGRTNRTSLLAGASEAGLGSVIVVPDRPAAVDWVRQHLGSGDAVLYENDLPDHYA
jgi:UDP-N-acetylmuramoyl-tripeptide--D-alanyl-D-alanine ligase